MFFFSNCKKEESPIDPDEIKGFSLLSDISGHWVGSNETAFGDFDNFDKKVERTINVQSTEDCYSTTYLHPDNYYITLFSDQDGNFYPSSGDVASVSMSFEVTPESDLSTAITVDLLIP